MILRRHIVLSFFLVLFISIPISVGAQADDDCDLTINFDSYTDRGEEAFNAGDLEAALAEVRCAIAVAPERPVGYYNLGFLLAELGNADEALENYAEAIRLDPAYRSAYLNRASLYSSLQRYEDTIADYDSALELEPEAPVYNLRGVAYFNLSDYESAEADFAQAIALAPTNPDYARNRAASRFRLERYDEAYEDFLIASQLAPDWEVPVFGMADALYSDGRYDEALTHYRDGIARFGTNNARDTRIRRISVIRSGNLIDNRVTPESGSITADTIFQLFQLDRLEGDAISHVNGLAITPNGLLIAASDDSGVVSMWDKTGRPLAQIDISGSVKNLIASPDGAFLALVADDARVVLIAAGSQAIVGQWDGGDAGSAALQGIAFSPDGGLLAGVWEDGSIRVYDPYLRARVGSLAQAEPISAASAIDFSPNGRFVSIATDANTVQLWDILDNVLAVTWRGAEEAINTLAFEASGARLFAGTDEAIYYWLTSDPVVVQIPSSAPVQAIRFSPDSLLMLAAGENLAMYNAETVEPIAELSGEDGAWSAVAFSPDGNRLLAARSGSEIGNPLVIFEPFTTTITLDAGGYAPITVDNAASLEVVTEVALNDPRGVIWSADGDTLFAGSNSGVFSLPLDGGFAGFVEQPRGTFAIHDGSPVFQTVETGAGGQQTLTVYDVEDFEEPLIRYEVDNLAIRSFVYTDDGLIALSTPARDGRFVPELILLPLDEGEPQSITPGGTEALSGIAVRGDGVSATALRHLGSEMVRSLSISMFNEDSSPYASINAPIPYIDLAGNIVLGFVQSLSFSPDGTMIAAIGSPDILRVWQETEPGVWQAIANLEATGAGLSTYFSPSGGWLFSRGNEAVILWRIEQDEDERARVSEAARIPVAASAVQGSIRFNADDTLLAIITTGDMLQIWGVKE